MTVPAYYRSRAGQVFRLQRVHKDEGASASSCYQLRACWISKVTAPPKGSGANSPVVVEAARTVRYDAILDRMQRHQAALTAEQVYEDLWQNLRLQLEAFTPPGSENGT